jgi:hypothetical protein
VQEADQIPAIFQEETGVSFTVALPSGDMDSAEQTIVMVPHIDDPRHKSDFETSPVLLWINPTVRGSLNGVSIPVPVADRNADGSGYDLRFDATARPYIIPLVPEMMEEMEGTTDNIAFFRISIPSAHQSVKTVISEIGFHWPVKIENGRYHPVTGLLVIPLTRRNSCHPNAPVDGEKSNVSSRVR